MSTADSIPAQSSDTPSVTTKPPPSFGRAGRPRRISFSDLFLWEPSIEVDLCGVSITEALGEGNAEMLALYRDFQRKRKISRERVVKVLPAALNSFGFQLADEFRKALNGEESQIKDMGYWECHLYSRAMKPDSTWPPHLTPFGRHIVEIERALVEPTLAWRENDFVRCADLIESAPSLSGYLWPEVIAKIRNATTQQQINESRFLVSLEIQLSWLACWDAQLQVDGYADRPILECLFPNFNAENIKHPNALFFEWLACYSKTSSKLASRIDQISKPAGYSDIATSRRQLRRWKSGGGFPSIDVLDSLFRNLYGDRAREKADPNRRNWDLCWTMAMACKRIGFLMHILTRLSKVQGPVFPFGHTSVQDWRESRYGHWYEHWLSLLEAG